MSHWGGVLRRALLAPDLVALGHVREGQEPAP
jgi:hypothetical protein